MKYIGSFFRINSMSIEEIESQLLFLSRESIKHILLESKCGISISQKTLKKNFDKEEYNKIKDYSPLLSIYSKGKPIIYLSQNSKSWDESTFRKDVDVSSNALMTISLLKLAKYYEKFKNIDNELFNLSKTYKKISKIQLDFYYKNLRNKEGFFVEKKNISATNSSYPELLDKATDISFSEQAYMMVAYYLYSLDCDDIEDKNNFKEFSLEILDMFSYFKEKIYENSLTECCHLCFALNLMFKYSKIDKCKELLVDLCDFILSVHLEVGFNSKDFSDSTLVALNLFVCYKNTGISLFKENFIDICKSLKNVFNSEFSIFTKPGDKKEIKYYNLELVLYLANLMLYNKNIEKDKSLESIICQFYKGSIVNSSILASFPEAPTIDSAERYKNFSKRSIDLLDETMFKSIDSSTPDLTALAPVFVKSQSFSKKKKTFSSSKTNFESFNNLFIFTLIIELFNDDYIEFISPNLITLPKKESPITKTPVKKQSKISSLDTKKSSNSLKENNNITLTTENSSLNDFIEMNNFDDIKLSDSYNEDTSNYDLEQ
ncbi:MAG: hypothetical protein ACRDD2_11105 [Sarcina sp.]